MANLLFRASSTATTPTSTTVKNAPLTNLEIDGNFKSIKDDLANKPTLTGTGAVGTWSISVTGNAGSVTNGVYTNESYANPSWITSLNASKLTGAVSNPSWITSLDGTKLTGTVVATNGVVTTGSYSNPNWITSLDGTKVTNAVLTTGSYSNPNWITSLSQTKVLPSQGGNANELLVTNGSTASWSQGLTYSSGTLTTTDFNSTSDITLKKNVKTVESALDIVDRLNGVEFEWKNTDKKSSGVVAQELEEVLPHLVATNDDGIKTVNYAGLTAYLIQAIKELNSKI